MKSMHALRFDRFGEIEEVLHVADVDVPKPRAGEVLVRVAASSINPSDVKNVLGVMKGTTLPRTPGRDFAGTVVDGPKEMIGLEVWGSGGDIGFTRDGAHAEFVVVPQEGVASKPASLTMVEAASVGTNYVTAYLGLIETGHVSPGEWVVVTGAMGGVGSSVIQLAKWKQAHVVAVVRTKPTDEFLQRYDVDAVTSSETEDIVAHIKESTGGRGASLAYDCVGGPLFEKCLKSLAEQGRQINITSVGDRRVSFDLLDFYHNQLTLYGVDSRGLDTISCARVLNQLEPAFNSGVLRPPRVALTCTLGQAIDAYPKVGNGSAGGKVVLEFEDVT